MHISVEKIAEEALALPSEARALLADRLWIKEARLRIEEVRSGGVATISGEIAFDQVRAAIQE